MGADADDQRRPLLVGHQHRHVLAGPGGGDDLVVEPRLQQPLPARRPAVGVGVDDQLGAAAQRRVAGRVHVAEDHVGLQPALRGPRRRRRRRRRSAAARRGCRRAALSGRGGGGRRGRRSGRGGRGSWPGSAGRRCCRSAGRSLRARGRPCSRRIRASASSIRCAVLLHLALELGDPRGRGRAATSSPPTKIAPPSIRTRSPSLSRSKSSASGASIEADPRAGQHQRPGVRVPALRGGRGVEHRDDPGFDQLLGGDAVDVDVVDDRDLAGAQALDQVLGPLARAGRRLRSAPPAARRSCARAGQEGDDDWWWPPAQI